MKNNKPHINTSSSRSVVVRDISCCAIPRTETLRGDGKRVSGFTLIELLVVVLIIGILSAIALPQYTKAVERARASEAEIMLRTLRDAQARCFLELGSDSLSCQQDGGDGGLFAHMDIDTGTLVDDPYNMGCEDCAIQGKHFIYSVDGDTIEAIRVQNNTYLYIIITSGRPGSEDFNQFRCWYYSGNPRNYCKDAGYTIQKETSWFKP